MKKTTYTKSFTGWGFSRDTAKFFAGLADFPMSKEESPLYCTGKEAEVEMENFAKTGKPVKVKVTYTVTLEPVASKK